jgi:hypothetical protein
MLRKTAILTFLVLAASISISAETLKIDAGGSKTSKAGKIKVTFVRIEEDSRCPVGTQCVWAGNARVKIKLSKGRKAPKTYELNSTLDPRTLTFEGYDIAFVNLSPQRSMSKVAARNVKLTVSITRHE